MRLKLKRFGVPLNKGHNFIDLNASPAPTIMADGLGGIAHGQYWIEDSPDMRTTKDDKPPYRVPSMSEIAKLKSKYRVVSTFSGCGGSCLGFRMAGYKVVWANEFVPAAQETYRANAPMTPLDPRDIRKITAKDIRKVIGKEELDVLEGSPPCASFSTAGKRAQAWGLQKSYSDTVQRTDDLFFEYIRLLEGLTPRVFVAENVSGLVKGVAKGYFLEILAAMKAVGYNVTCRVLDAQWLGVPQMRQRTIFVGVREDLKLSPAHPKPLPYRYSVRDALPYVDQIQTGSFCAEWRDSGEPMGTITQSDGTRPHRSAIQLVAPSRQKADAFNTTVVRFSKPSPAITVASSGNDTAVPMKDSPLRRKFTIEELKRICGFPDDFILTGTYAQQWERLGRSVPPVMMSHIARTVRTEILDQCAAS